MRVKRALVPDPGTEIVTYENEPKVFKCTQNDQIPTGGRPYIVAVGSNATVAKPTFDSTLSQDSKTVEATIHMTPAYNIYKLTCKNDDVQTPDSDTDRPFLYTVRYYRLDPQKSLTNNPIHVKSDGLTGIDMADWVIEQNWNLEYKWTGASVPDNQKTDPIVQWQAKDYPGKTDDVTLVMKMQGDTGDYTQKTIKFQLTFDNVNSASITQTSITTICLLVFVAYCVGK